MPAVDNSYAPNGSGQNGIAEDGIAGLQSFGNSLPEGIRPGNGGLLSLKDITARLETDYSRLRRLADAPGIGELAGAVDVPGAKGVRYEPRAVEVFRRLIAASDAKALTPATAAAWLTAQESKALTAPEPSETSIAGKPQSGNPVGGDLATRSLAAVLSPILAPVVSIMQEVRDLLRGRNALDAPAAPPQDRLLTAEEAAALLACRPRSVSRHVAPVLPRKWRESDVLRFIAGLGEQEGQP